MHDTVENWSDLHGRIEEVIPAEDRTEDLVVYVLAAEAVPGFANLLEDARGRMITVRVPLEGDNRPAPGDGLRGRVCITAEGRCSVQPGSWTVEPAPHEY